MSDVGGVSMAPAELGDAMRLLSAAGERFGVEWQSHQGVISAGEGAIGGGRLAAAFRPNYGPAAESVRAAAGRIPGAFGATSAAGTASATEYVGTDADAARQFAGVRSMGLR
ncbi:hypothetical protein [Actinokineospora sp.]|uniref:hypothetical protein n=1 Tax=Actinokineospora sp. TaxID=1872133 RepID=UPI0040381C3B